MATTITKVHDAFELLYESLCDKDFSKSLYLEHWGERYSLPLVRTFLLGYFGKNVIPEAAAILPSSDTGLGRLDFIVDDVAVELAVRKPGNPKRDLNSFTNETEVMKLLKYPGKAILVLFDFADSPLTAAELKEFRNLPSFGRGNHSKSPFQVSYFHKDFIKGIPHVKLQVRAPVRFL